MSVAVKILLRTCQGISPRLLDWYSMHQFNCPWSEESGHWSSLPFVNFLIWQRIYKLVQREGFEYTMQTVGAAGIWLAIFTMIFLLVKTKRRPTQTSSPSDHCRLFILFAATHEDQSLPHPPGFHFQVHVTPTLSSARQYGFPAPLRRH
jgi:hypothetical protein